MTTNRIPQRNHERAPTVNGYHVKSVRLPDGRYLRFSHRYNAWQVQDTHAGIWRNVSVPMARSYAAAGFPIGVQA